MWKSQPPPEKKSPPLSQQPPLKVEVLSSTPFLKIWLQAQPPALQKGAGGAHYDNSRLPKKPYLEESETFFER